MTKRPEQLGDEYAEKWLRNEFSQISHAIAAAIREDRAEPVSERVPRTGPNAFAREANTMCEHGVQPRPDLVCRHCAEQTLATARSTISEQEKRIAAFEKHHKEQARLISGLAHDAERSHDALTSERQRRGEADRIIRLINPNLRLPESIAAQAYFRKYEPIPADREEERGG